jgi:uncharacterized protein (DUF2384 family)
MSIKRMTEEELLAKLDAHKVHAEELADTLPHELTPLERLKDSVKCYDRPTDPGWDNYFNPNQDAGSSLRTFSVGLRLDPSIYHSPAISIATVRAGISGHVLKRALEHFDSKQIFARALSTNVAGLEAYCGEKPLDRQRSEVVLDTMRTLDKVQRIWGSDEAAQNWLHSKVPALGGAVPAEMFDSYEGRRWVAQVVKKIEYGDFS